MKKEKQKNLCVAVCMLAAFILWTAAVQFIDVQAIGPQGSSVGFAAMNHFVHRLTGVHLTLYNITDWLGLVPLILAMGFAVLGLVQWIKRKQLLNVDHSILVLGGFYLVVIAFYVLFDLFAVNYRPVLINGNLETSYPSSTTMLVLCVMPTAVLQFCSRIKQTVLRRSVVLVIAVFTVFMVLGRLLSGVHWFSDIVGGTLLSAGLVRMYRFAVSIA